MRGLFWLNLSHFALTEWAPVPRFTPESKHLFLGPPDSHRWEEEIGFKPGEGQSHGSSPSQLSRFGGQRPEKQTSRMKNVWLILGVLLVLVASAPQLKKKRKCKLCVNGTYSPGSFSVLRSRGDPEAAIFNETDVSPLPILESGKLVEPRLDWRTKRESLTPRRGRKRTGPRPPCRGCYSWLTIVAPPGQGIHNETSNQSLSESEEWSSEED